MGRMTLQFIGLRLSDFQIHMTLNYFGLLQDNLSIYSNVVLKHIVIDCATM